MYICSNHTFLSRKCSTLHTRSTYTYVGTSESARGGPAHSSVCVSKLEGLFWRWLLPVMLVMLLWVRWLVVELGIQLPSSGMPYCIKIRKHDNLLGAYFRPARHGRDQRLTSKSTSHDEETAPLSPPNDGTLSKSSDMVG